MAAAVNRRPHPSAMTPNKIEICKKEAKEKSAEKNAGSYNWKR